VVAVLWTSAFRVPAHNRDLGIRVSRNALNHITAKSCVGVQVEDDNVSDCLEELAGIGNFVGDIECEEGWDFAR
jgi:hypothetical protein